VKKVAESKPPDDNSDNHNGIKVEDALRESERRYRNLFETMVEGFSLDEIICDDNGKPYDLRYLAVNPAFERQTGLKAEDILGRTTLELFPDAESEWFEIYGKVALTGEPAQFEARFGPLDRWFDVSAFRTEPGRFAVVFFDITERKQAEETLKESETKYRNLFENMTEEVHFWKLVRDEEGGIKTWALVDANPPTLKTWGKSLDEIKGKTTDEIFGPGATEHYRAVVEKIMTEGVPYSFEDYFLHLDKYFRFTSIPLGEYYITTGADITVLKKAHKALQAANEELRARTRKLEELNDELQASREEIDAQNEELKASMEELQLEVLERKRAEEELRRVNRTLKALSNSSAAMVQAESELDYLEEVCRIIVEDCGHAMVWVGYAEENEEKTVRPVACSGFEEGYLETLNVAWADTDRGRGPTGTAIRNGKPSPCRDMHTDPRFAPWREEALKRGYASSICLPMSSDKEVFGAITIYSRLPDPFSEAEITLLSKLADDLAYGITHLRLQDERERDQQALKRINSELQVSKEEIDAQNEELLASNEELQLEIQVRKRAEIALVEARAEAEQRAMELQAVLEAVPAAIWIARDPKCDVIVGNSVANQFYEAEEGENVSANMTPVRRFFRDGRELSAEELPMQDAVAKNSDVEEEEFEVVMPSGKRRHLLGGATVLQGPDGQPTGCVAAFIDISQRKLTEQQLAEARADAERHASEMESFFASMTEGVVLQDAQGNTVFSNQAAREILGTEPQVTIEERVEQHYARHLDGTPMRPEETASGRALKGETVRELRYKITNMEGLEKVISVNSSPIRSAEGTILGAATVFQDFTDKAEFERQQQELFEREHRIAEVLQKATLPPDVPSEIVGYHFAVKYRPALSEAEIGGDFYDLFDLGDGRFAFLIGDVVGKGLKAAIRVAEARHTLRSYAYIDPRPSSVISLSNDALCREAHDDPRMLTVCYAVVDPASNRLTYSVAGHDPPIVCNSSGLCLELESHGLPMGIVPKIEYGESSYTLDLGDMVVLITDGITEARKRDNVFFGRKGLIDYVAKNPNLSIDEIATGIMDAATAHASGRLQDDAAVVVLSVGARERF
jgi:PAS domain S-box-containing protein